MALNSEGTYPIGRSGCWHGGIHNIGDSLGWIKPYFSGNALVCKIQKDYYKFSLCNTITEKEFNSLDDEEKKAYTIDEKGYFYKAEKPPERDYSTSYVLLEHKITVYKVQENSQEGSKEIDLDFNFFTLYMHLLPYGVWGTEQENFNQIPFYLKWGTFEVINTNKKTPYLNIDNNRIYGGTKYIIADNKIFYPDKGFGENDRVTITTKTGKQNDSEICMEIPTSYVEKPLTMKLKPLKTGTVPLYSPNVSNPIYSQEFTLLGNIKAGVDDSYRVNFEKTAIQIPLMKTKKLIFITIKNDDNIVDNCLKGIIQNAVVKKQNPRGEWLYEENPATTIVFEVVSLQTYINIVRPSEEQLIVKSGLVVTFEGEKCVIIASENTIKPQQQSNCDFFAVYNGNVLDNPAINKNLRELKVASYSTALKGKGNPLYLYQLKKKLQLPNNYNIKETSPKSQVSGFTAVQINFEPNKDYLVVANAEQFELLNDERPTRILEIPPGEDSQEEGIPCYDKDGYIRGLLHRDDTFSLDGDRFSDKDRITITKVKDFTPSMKLYINYNKNELELQNSGVEVNDKNCETISRGKETELCVLKQNSEVVKVNSSDLIGKGGTFDKTENLYHLETFFTDDKFIRDLFAGKYTLNRYQITEKTQLYTKTPKEGYKLYFPALMEWSLYKTCGKYSKIILKRFALYFLNNDVKGENGKYTINKNIKKFYVQNESVALNSSNSQDEFKKYREFIRSLLPLEKEFEEEPIYADPGIKGLYFDSNSTGINLFTCWIETDFLNKGFNKEEDGLYKVGGPKRKKCDTYTVYDEYPNSFEKTEGTAIATVFNIKTEQSELGIEYAPFSYKGKIYYCKKEGLEKENALDWGKEFTMIDDKKHVNGIYCDDINAALGMKVKEQGQEPVCISDDKLLKLRDRVCKFPMEWNKEYYKLCRKNADCEKCENICNMKRISEIMSRADIWNEIKDKIKTEENSIWHVHPDFFRSYVIRNLIHEFNPYYGKEIFGKIVIDNPGFAPFVGGNKFDGYAELTSGFNAQTAKTTHAGIDFYAKVVKENEIGHSPVHSFIYGKVVYSGNLGDSGFGTFLIIQSNENYKHYFLLGHLKKNSGVPKDTQVTPGMTVAYASNTGNCWTGKPSKQVTPEQRILGIGTHLHVQFIVSDNMDFFDKNNNILYNVIDRKSYNPFNYSEKWDGKKP